MEGTIGEIRMFAGTFAPRNWAFCSGQLMSISQNTALFSILGTTYGGNGQTTFGLPDLRGRVPVGTGQGPGLSNVQLGEMSGTPSVTLTAANLPPHNHTLSGTVSLPCTSAPGNADTPVENIPAASATDENYADSGAANGAMAAGNVSGTTGVAGSGQPFNNMQPYLGMNYIVCLFGIFPSRN